MCEGSPVRRVWQEVWGVHAAKQLGPLTAATRLMRVGRSWTVLNHRLAALSLAGMRQRRLGARGRLRNVLIAYI